jgi:transposase
MAQFISRQKKEIILSAVKNEGMGIINAAKKHNVSEKTIRKWLRTQTKNEHTSTAEVEKLKRENQT